VHVDKIMINTADRIFVCHGDVTDDAVSRFVVSHMVASQKHTYLYTGWNRRIREHVASIKKDMVRFLTT